MIIGLYSPAPQSGKTSVANVLQEHGFGRVPFAAPLKRMTCEFLENLGYLEGEAARMVFFDKHETVPELGVSVRHLLQTLGTEWGRDCVHAEVWVKCWAAQADRYERVVVDDVRFPNEAAAIKVKGGVIWQVVRQSAVHEGPHRSEGGLDGYKFDAVIQNDGSFNDLRSKVLALL
jgi:hypothetical protein